MDRKKKPAKRRSIRFPADSGDFALLDLTAKGTFKPTIPALIINESFKGCGLVAMHDSKLKTGAEVKVRVGKLAVMHATIVWKTDLDDQIIKIGLEYTA